MPLTIVPPYHPDRPAALLSVQDPDMKLCSVSVEAWRASATLDFLMPRHRVAKLATETRRRHSPQDIRCHPQFAFVVVLHWH
jgi:hypothetical protein